MLFEEKDFGQRITQELSRYLREYTNGEDRCKVADEFEKSESNIRGIIYRQNKLTENMAPSIVGLIKLGAQNASSQIKHGTDGHEYFSKLLDKVESRTIEV